MQFSQVKLALSKKRQYTIVLEFQRSWRVSIFFFEIRKLGFFQESQCFLCLPAFITLFQSLIGYVCVCVFLVERDLIAFY